MKRHTFVLGILLVFAASMAVSQIIKPQAFADEDFYVIPVLKAKGASPEDSYFKHGIHVILTHEDGGNVEYTDTGTYASKTFTANDLKEGKVLVFYAVKGIHDLGGVINPYSYKIKLELNGTQVQKDTPTAIGMDRILGPQSVGWINSSYSYILEGLDVMQDNVVEVEAEISSDGTGSAADDQAMFGGFCMMIGY